MGGGNNITEEAKAIILEQMKKSICQVNGGTGFFCLMHYPDNCNLLPVLITSKRFLNENNLEIGKKFTILLNNGETSHEINIDEDR